MLKIFPGFFYKLINKAQKSIVTLQEALGLMADKCGCGVNCCGNNSSVDVNSQDTSEIFQLRVNGSTLDIKNKGNNATVGLEIPMIIDVSPLFTDTWRFEKDNPLGPSYPDVLNYNVDWGDGNTATGATGLLTHTYAAGNYRMLVTGDYQALDWDFFNSDLYPVIVQFGSSPIKDGYYWGGSGYGVMAPTNQPNLSLAGTGTTEGPYFAEFAWHPTEGTKNWKWPATSDGMRYFFYFPTSTPLGPVDLSGWEFPGVTSLEFCFSGTGNDCVWTGLDTWDVSNVQIFDSMVYDNTAFNSKISGWNMSSATSVQGMFDGATAFNQPIGNWTLPSTVTSLNSFLRGATAFNQPLDNFVGANVTDIRGMLQNATSFDQDLSSWNITGVTLATNFLAGAGLSTANYNSTLISWAAQNPGNAVSINFGSSTYSGKQATDARDKLVNVHGWTIVDGGAL